MAEDASPPKQLLLVDDDPEFLAAVTALLKEMSGGRWAIRGATNHSQAMELLSAQTVDTIVLDVEMPVMDGIEFLRLLGRTHPGQQVVMLSGRLDETTRKTCLDLGAAMFLEKPVSGEGFRALFTALGSLSASAPQSGFRGVMRNIGLEDILQMECLSRKSSILVVATANRGGQIYICDGQIIHAQLGQLQGEMALYGLLALARGEFKLEPFAEPPRRTVAGDYQFLLMEAARLRDEAEGQAHRSPGRLDRPTDFGADSLETPVQTEARGARIEEVLLCSSTREVLYQSKCESIEARLELLANIEQCALSMAKGTPSGRFHRVSMETRNTRLLAAIQPGFKLLVRSTLPPQAPSNE